MNALHQYQSVNAQTSVVDVDRHQLIQLLFDGAVERINMAKARIAASDFEGKNRLINKSIEIISGLRSFLDLDKGQEVAQNLFDLYVYCEHRLFEANVKNDLEMLEEVLSHLKKIQGAWSGIRQEVIEKGIL
ncbi:MULTISPECIES: flagellar export chaperone FliS [unclassified Oleiphilus]|jgi:flagellar protein FliS|uniref:flagellar export chaperone FliS n=2 Tax=Oleiphilus TaxID=141450 RepID=UPI0007C22987|nr:MULTISPECIES: flagellar export chaperone FliS [unclassified Oleiphilus]KZY45413.1 flagellar protein FliS [Oleiphilus sp. HI0050]KZY79625.1 flagellar protein FliS [Oleiphilus sp. HI0069]KZY80524.1 flagellar protein FliS [Oleiphilus sp. HI0068]KZY90585.1 flagellar protein FliS [Oleiphilus sp. HI0072]KZZ19311.1 flagellar protein FliS [Oleiphilus sp. HI0081]KZZ20125.1 flagellar protein FliS [Oleiphilus sp. HI0078]KZZ47030.1 flagellar protein FliS [Oleiphilus sp. HI0085]